MMGFGTTAISAEKYNCSWFGYELIPEYVNLAYERIVNSRKVNRLLWKDWL